MTGSNTERKARATASHHSSPRSSSAVHQLVRSGAPSACVRRAPGRRTASPQPQAARTASQRTGPAATAWWARAGASGVHGVG